MSSSDLIHIQKGLLVEREGKGSFILLFDRNLKETLSGLTVYTIFVTIHSAPGVQEGDATCEPWRERR